MKGHVGDGARSGGLRAPGTGNQVDAKHVLRIHTFDKCRYRLLEAHAVRVGELRFAPVWCVTQLESLILAQNERWRHA